MNVLLMVVSVIVMTMIACMLFAGGIQTPAVGRGRQKEELEEAADSTTTLASNAKEPALSFALRRSVLNSYAESYRDRIVVPLQRLSRLLTDFDKELDATEPTQESELLYYELDAQVSTLLQLLHENHYGSVLANPEYWDNPERIKDQVVAVAGTVAENVEKSLRALNSAKAFESSVISSSIIGKGSLTENSTPEKPEQLKHLLENSNQEKANQELLAEISEQYKQVEATRAAETAAQEKREKDEAKARAIREKQAAREESLRDNFEIATVTRSNDKYHFSILQKDGAVFVQIKDLRDGNTVRRRSKNIYTASAVIDEMVKKLK